MNRIRRSGLTCLVVILTLSLFVVGCTQEMLCGFCYFSCVIDNYGVIPEPDWIYPGCMIICAYTACLYPFLDKEGAGNPDECAATFEQLQLEAIQFCEAYPEECQEYFDSYVESLDTEARE